MSNSDNKKPSDLSRSMSAWGKAANPATNEVAKAQSKIPPQQSNALLDALSQYLTRPVAEGLYYNRKKIILDGFKFIGCRFDNCQLVVSALNFEIVNCVIDPSTTIEYAGETVKIIRLFHAHHNEWHYPSAPFFAPRKNADGSITIDGAAQ